MQSLSLTGRDTFVLSGPDDLSIVFASQGDGDVGNFEFPNDFINVTVGKNGNVVSALNYKGSMCNATFRLLRGSPEDIFLNGYLARMVADAPSFAPGMSAVFQKRIGIVTGDVISDTYNFAFGFPKKLPEVKENAEGATDQGLVMWSIVFGSSLRVL